MASSRCPDGNTAIVGGAGDNGDTGAAWVFVQVQPILSVSVTGSGTVTSSPAGINCRTACSASFATGTQVTLTATSDAGWSFAGWNLFSGGGPAAVRAGGSPNPSNVLPTSVPAGQCPDFGKCAMTMNSNQSVFASFFTSGGSGGSLGSSTGTGTAAPRMPAPTSSFPPLR